MDDIENVAGVIFGFFFGGLLIIMIATNTPSFDGDLALWGVLAVAVAIFLGVLTIGTAVSEFVKG